MSYNQQYNTSQCWSFYLYHHTPNITPEFHSFCYLPYPLHYSVQQYGTLYAPQNIQISSSSISTQRHIIPCQPAMNFPSNYHSEFTQPQNVTSHTSAPHYQPGEFGGGYPIHNPIQTVPNYSPPAPTNTQARPVYMQDILQLARLDVRSLQNKVESFDMYSFPDNKVTVWQCGKEQYVDFLKRFFFWSNLAIINFFAIKGIDILKQTYTNFLLKYIKERTYERIDFIDHLIWKWQDLTKNTCKDGVEDFNQECYRKVLRKINVSVSEQPENNSEAARPYHG